MERVKDCNKLRSFPGGWVVGLSDSNRVLVQGPADVYEPYPGASCAPDHDDGGFGVFGLPKGVPEGVLTEVRRVWRLKREIAWNTAKEPPLDFTGEDTSAGDYLREQGVEFFSEAPEIER